MNIKQDLQALLSPDFAEMLEDIREFIIHSETGEESSSEESHGFLWEHTLHAAAMCLKICRFEEIDPLIPVLAALFHDAGKFAEGQVHADDLPEEEGAAAIAEFFLRKAKADGRMIQSVAEAVRRLYREGEKPNHITDIVHDADFLSKSGRLGLFTFFSKAALRGKNLERTLMEDAGKELTYADALTGNMRTAAGKQMAAEKRTFTLDYFQSLILELKKDGIAAFEIRNVLVPCPNKKRGTLRINIVLPETCPSCGGSWIIDYAVEAGLKCQKLTAFVHCPLCATRRDQAFCLPEISPCT